MRTVIITFTHEGMKVAKKASTVTDGEVTIYCHKDVRMITGKMQFLLPLSAVLLRTSSQCATGYYLCVRLQ